MRATPRRWAPGGVTSTVTRAAQRGARRVRDSDAVRRAARFGPAARGVFYLLLAYLTVRVATDRPGEADPRGALHVVAMQPVGEALIALAAAALAVFALARLVLAVGHGTHREWREALRPAAEGIAYAAMAAFTVAFLVGSREEGSEESHRSITARLLDAPAGRWLVAAIGLTVIGFYVHQLWHGLTRGFEDKLDRRRMGPLARKAAAVSGTSGHVGRVLAFVPVGVFLIVAAATHEASDALGLDATLQDLSTHWWGLLMLALVALGFTAFGIYCLLEAAYRKVDRS